MTSFSSRPGSWLRRTMGKAEDATPAAPAARRSDPVEAPIQSVAAPARVIRLGLDFGTTTTLAAVRVDSGQPRLIPLEDGIEAIPSVYWRGPAQDGDGATEAFGSQAAALPGPVRSVKLRIRENLPTDETYGELPSEIARRIVVDAMRRALEELKRQGLLPPSAERLDVTSNVGCSAAWDLSTRERMRAIARMAGLQVEMLNVVEEPVAASLAVMLTGAFSGGRLLLVDLGGGTLDACVLRGDAGVNRFRIFASGGREDLGGDRYTDLIRDHLVAQRAVAEGTSEADLRLTYADLSRLWQVAEAAKLSLSTRDSVQVALGTRDNRVATITREWFEEAAQDLVVRTLAAIADVYLSARLVLDRGLTPKDWPGTPYLSIQPPESIESLRFEDDSLQHLDHVVLVGGASQMPMIRRAFQRIFGFKLEDPGLYGLEPVSAIVLGLGQHEAIESLDFGYPNWAIEAAVTAAGQQRLHTLYSPFAPIFRWDGTTGPEYSQLVDLPAGATSCRLEFRRVAPDERRAWPERRLPVGCSQLRLNLTLLGDVRLSAVTPSMTEDLYPDEHATPWKEPGATHPAYLPRYGRAVPTLCEHDAKPGTCEYIACRNHPFGGMPLDSE